MKEIDELVEETASKIALDKNICVWEVWETIPEVYQDMFRGLAKQILSHPGLAVIVEKETDDNLIDEYAKKSYELGRKWEGKKISWDVYIEASNKLSQEYDDKLMKKNWKQVIPLKEAMNE